MEPVTVKTSIDFKTYFKIGLSSFYAPKRVWILFAYIAFLNVLTFYDVPFNWPDEWYIIGVSLFLFFVVFPVITWIKCKLIMKRHPLFQEEITYQIDKDTIAYTTESSSSSSNWKYVTKVREIDTHFLLFTSAKGFHFLAKDGFSSASDMERFKDMVKANKIVAYFR